MTAVGFAGLGRMGVAMATHLADAEFPLTVHNRSPERAAAFAAAHRADVADTPAALAARSDVLISMLSDGPASRDLLTGPDGVLAGLAPGSVVVNMATTGADETASMAALVEDAGSAYVDGPVSGSVATAEAAALTIMAGGEDDVVARVSPVLEVVSQRIFHLGPVGTGTAMKLAVNAMLFGINQALAEALVLAEKSGIDRSLAYDVFASSAVAAPVVHYRRDIFEFPGERPVTFPVRLARKDLALALALAESVDAAMPQAALNAGFMDDAAAAGWDEADMADVARVLRGERPDGAG